MVSIETIDINNEKEQQKDNGLQLKQRGRTKSYYGIVHRCELVIKLNKEFQLDIIEDLVKNTFTNYNTKETKGEIYTAKVFKESKGETITVFIYPDNIVVQFITHKLERLQKYIDFTQYYKATTRSLGVELYIRIHYTQEKRAEIILESLRKALGLGKIQIVKQRQFYDKNYLFRLERFTYEDCKVSVKLYYDKEMKEMPKIEVFVSVQELNLDKVIKTGSKILVSIVKAGNLIQIYNEYDQEQDKIKLDMAITDPLILKRTRGTKPRVKGETILEKQVKDKHKIVKELLVKGYKPKEIAKMLNYSDRHVKRIIAYLLDIGEVKRIGKGKYIDAKKQEEVKHPLPIHVIMNEEYPDVKIVFLPKHIKTLDHAASFIKTQYKNCDIHPEELRIKGFPPVFICKEDHVYYIKTIYRYY